MKAKVKAIWSADVDERAWTPDDPDIFSFQMQIAIGPEEGEGHEVFYATICSPGWISANLDNVVIGWGIIIVDRYDMSDIEEKVKEWVSMWDAESWRELALLISRIGAWEFDHTVNRKVY